MEGREGVARVACVGLSAFLSATGFSRKKDGRSNSHAADPVCPRLPCLRVGGKIPQPRPRSADAAVKTSSSLALTALGGARGCHLPKKSNFDMSSCGALFVRFQDTSIASLLRWQCLLIVAVHRRQDHECHRLVRGGGADAGCRRRSRPSYRAATGEPHRADGEQQLGRRRSSITRSQPPVGACCSRRAR
jgi:hypothetical protein